MNSDCNLISEIDDLLLRLLNYRYVAGKVFKLLKKRIKDIGGEGGGDCAMADAIHHGYPSAYLNLLEN